MGFLGGITERLLGGTDNSAQKGQIRANQEIQDYVRQQTGIARGDVLQYSPMGDYARNAGYNQGLGLVQEGNVLAQHQLLAGMPQFQNAILGLPYNNSALQPMQVGQGGFQPSVQLPNFEPPQQYPQQGPAPQAAPQQRPPQEQSPWADLVAQMFSGGGPQSNYLGGIF